MKINITIIFALVSFLFTCNIDAFRTNLPDDDSESKDLSYLYRYAGRTLYDQTDLIETEEFQNAPPEAQQDMLESLFHQKRLAAHYRMMASNALWTTPAVLIPIITAYALRKRLKKIPTVTALASGITIAGLIAEGAHTIFFKIKDCAKAIKELYLSPSTQSETSLLEIDYVRIKPELPLEWQVVLEKNFLEIYLYQYESIALKERKQAIKLLLNLPREVKKISYDSQKINKLLQGYNPTTTRELKRFCIRHVAACNQESVRKMVAYFHGSPGVGKTRAAQLIAQALGVPCATISLGDLTIEQFVGSPEQPGLFLNTIAQSHPSGEKNKNMILLIDDADRILLNPQKADLLSFLLTLLEPETRLFYSPFLDISLDISHIGIIMTGNNQLTDAALINRLQIVPFSSYDKEYKRKVVWQTLYPALLQPHQEAALALSEADFTQADQDAINTLVDADIDPGFRTIKLSLMNYLEDKVLCKYFASYEDPSVCFRQQELHEAPRAPESSIPYSCHSEKQALDLDHENTGMGHICKSS